MWIAVYGEAPRVGEFIQAVATGASPTADDKVWSYATLVGDDGNVVFLLPSTFEIFIKEWLIAEGESQITFCQGQLILVDGGKPEHFRYRNVETRLLSPYGVQTVVGVRHHAVDDWLANDVAAALRWNGAYRQYDVFDDPESAREILLELLVLQPELDKRSEPVKNPRARAKSEVAFLT